MPFTQTDCMALMINTSTELLPQTHIVIHFTICRPRKAQPLVYLVLQKSYNDRCLCGEQWSQVVVMECLLRHTAHCRRLWQVSEWPVSNTATACNYCNDHDQSLCNVSTLRHTDMETFQGRWEKERTAHKPTTKNKKKQNLWLWSIGLLTSKEGLGHK